MTRRSFDDVAIGDAFGPAEECVDLSRVRHFLNVRGASRVDGRFTSLEAARALGLPRLLVPGPLLAGILDRTVRGWLPSGRLTKLDLVFRRTIWQDAPFAVHAVVVDAEVREGAPTIDLDLTVTDEQGEACVTGAATIVFPEA